MKTEYLDFDEQGSECFDVDCECRASYKLIDGNQISILLCDQHAELNKWDRYEGVFRKDFKLHKFLMTVKNPNGLEEQEQ